jgi:type I restriction enzyme, R subunit
VRPLECLLFMRDVKSRNYFEQMKGRGTRTLDKDGLRKVTPSARTGKTHYVIVDAIGVTRSLKTASEPLITKPSVPLKDLAMGVMMGARDEDTVSSLAGRLARLDKQLDDADRARIAAAAKGTSLAQIVGDLLGALDPDRIDTKAQEIASSTAPTEAHRAQARDRLVGDAAAVFTGPLIELIDTIRRDKEQTLDHDNLDTLLRAEWAGESEENARTLAQEFRDYLEENRDRIEALTIFYLQPARRAEVTYAMIKSVLDALRKDRPKLAPVRVWQAYALLDSVKSGNPGTELTALVALIRRVCGLDSTLAPYADTVRRNFQTWIMDRHSGPGAKFADEQLAWLHMIRDHVASSMHIARTDLDLAPFDAQGGLGKMYQLFGDKMDAVIRELNEALAA